MKVRTFMTFAAGIGTCLVLIGILGAQQGPGTGSGPKAAVADLIYSLLIRIQKSPLRNWQKITILRICNLISR